MPKYENVVGWINNKECYCLECSKEQDVSGMWPLTIGDFKGKPGSEVYICDNCDGQMVLPEEAK